MKIKLLEGAVAPLYATEGSAGMDLVAHSFKEYRSTRTNSDSPNEQLVYKAEDLGGSEIFLQPTERLLVGCGFHIALPENMELQIRSRSGKTLKEGLVVANSPGTVDSDYRGEVGVILINTSSFPIEVKLGDKVAQGVLAKVEKESFEIVTELDETARGEGGYGSTDAKKLYDESNAALKKQDEFN